MHRYSIRYSTVLKRESIRHFMKKNGGKQKEL